MTGEGGLRMELTVEDPIFLLRPITYVMAWRPNGRPLSLPWGRAGGGPWKVGSWTGSGCNSS